MYRRLLGGGEKGLNARSNPNKREDSPELARTRLAFIQLATLSTVESSQQRESTTLTGLLILFIDMIGTHRT